MRPDILPPDAACESAALRRVQRSFFVRVNRERKRGQAAAQHTGRKALGSLERFDPQPKSN